MTEARPHALAGERVGVLGAACSLCGGRAESQVTVRAGATLNVHPGTRLEARCRECGFVDAYEPGSLVVWW